ALPCLAGTRTPVMMVVASSHDDGLCMVSSRRLSLQAISVVMLRRVPSCREPAMRRRNRACEAARDLSLCSRPTKKTNRGRRPIRKLLSISLLASLLASVSFAAEAGTITGTVKNADGTPFRAAFVRVQNTKTRMTMMVTSDRQGRYFTDDLAPGAYQ